MPSAAWWHPLYRCRCGKSKATAKGLKVIAERVVDPGRCMAVIATTVPRVELRDSDLQEKFSNQFRPHLYLSLEPIA